MNQNPPETPGEIRLAGLRLVTTCDGALPAILPAKHSEKAARGIALTADILFASDSDELDSNAAVNLDRLAAFLGKYRARTGLIEGYTDNTGVDFSNQDLSLRRAESVHSYLVAHGIDASRLHSIGRGSARPVASNESVVGRQQNRRVEVLISNDGSTNRAANSALDHVSRTQPLNMRQ